MPPGIRQSRWGATLHLLCASQQPVAGVQSCHVRFTPRLNDAKPQRRDGQTSAPTEKAGTFSRSPTLQARFTDRSWLSSEFAYLPKRRRKVRFDSGPNFWGVLYGNNAVFCPFLERERQVIQTGRLRGRALPK